jgi:hypothetical protein
MTGADKKDAFELRFSKEKATLRDDCKSSEIA